MTRDILLVLLGWFMGIVASPITEWLGRRGEAKRFRAAVGEELEEMRVRCIGVAAVSAIKRGELSRPLVKWYVENTKGYGGHWALGPRFAAALQQLADVSTDEQFAASAARMKIEAPTTPLHHPLQLTFLDSHLSVLPALTNRERLGLLDVKRRVAAFNNVAETGRFFFEATFTDQLSDRLTQIIDTNLELTQRRIAENALAVAESISAYQRASESHKTGPGREVTPLPDP